LRIIRPSEGDAPPIGRERDVAVNAPGDCLGSAPQHRRSEEVEVRICGIYRFDKIKIISVRSKHETLVRSWRGRDHLRVAASRKVAQPQALETLVVDYGRQVSAIWRNCRAWRLARIGPL